MIRLYKLLKSNTKRYVFLPLFLYWLLLLTLTSVPSLPHVSLFTLQDKFEHFGAYMVLAVLFTLSLHFQNKYSLLNKFPHISAFLIIAAYGLFDEIHQYFIPGRYFDWYDWLGDLLGAAAGMLISYYFIKKYSLITASNGT